MVNPTVSRFVAITFVLTLLGAAAPVSSQVTGTDAVLNGDFELAAHEARDSVCTVAGPGSIRVFEPGNPLGLPWLTSINACHSSALKAAGWSSGTTVDYDDHDGDGDREAKFIAGPPDPELGSHNMWQSYLNPQQAYVGNFSALRFRVEDGEIPSSAVIILSFNDSPLAEAHPFVGLYLMCQLTFPNAMLVPDETGTVTLDPTDGLFRARYTTCDDEAAAWATADPAGRAEILDGLRLVQHSYWSWNRGTTDVTIDDVTMLGSKTVAEALVS